MAYCEHCGNSYTTPKNHCRRCGKPFAMEYALAGGETVNMSENIATGIEQAHRRIAWRKSQVDGSNESLDIYLSVLGGTALLHGLAFMLGVSPVTMFRGPLGIILVAGVALGAFLKIVFDLRSGYTLGKSLLQVVLFGAITYGLVFGLFWYISENIVHSAHPLFDIRQFIPLAHPAASPTALVR